MELTTEKFAGLLGDCGYETRRYSGRGMYGAECVGVSLQDGATEVEMSAALMDTDDAEERAELRKILKGMRTDQLGRGTIAYFPKMKYEPEPEDAEEQA